MKQNDPSVQEPEHYLLSLLLWFFQTVRFTSYFTQSHNDTIILLIYMSKAYKVNKLVFII